MSITLKILGAFLFAALAVYCLWHGIKGLRTREVESPTMMSLGITKASDSPATYWILVIVWFFSAAVLSTTVFRWFRAIIQV